MKKAILLLVLLLVLGAAYWFVAMGDTPQDVGDREVEGTIVSVDTAQVPVDGPIRITLRRENDEQVIIAVPSMGINLCEARPNMVDAFSLRAGDEIEVRGSVGADNIIIPCESEGHYLKLNN